MAAISEKTMISLGVAVTLGAIVWTYSEGRAEARGTKELVMELKQDVKEIANRMMTRDQVEDLVARRIAESKAH